MIQSTYLGLKGINLVCLNYLSLLNKYVRCCSKVQNILQVTNLDRDPASGTALQEISFWLNLERALLRIQEKRESPEIALTLEILKHGKRFHATVSFDSDTGVSELWNGTRCINVTFKQLPLQNIGLNLWLVGKMCVVIRHFKIFSCIYVCDINATNYLKVATPYKYDTLTFLLSGRI